MKLADGREIADPGRALHALDLMVRRRLEGLLHGEHAGLRLGAGTEPEELIPYVPGADDVRRIDWNVTARSIDPHVWRPQAQHELDTWILLDESASMHFGTVSAEKRDVAAWVAGAVSLLARGPGNRVGIAHLRNGTGIRWDTPLPGQIAARRVLRAPGPDADLVAPSAAAPMSLAQAFAALERRATRPGLRVLITDFVEPDAQTERPLSWEPALRRLTARHDVMVIDIFDPRELALPDLGYVVLVDPETGQQREIFTSGKLRQEYAALAAHHRAAIAAGVRASGADHIALATDADWVRELARFIRGRRPGRRHRRGYGSGGPR